jgi:hypothetical protein
MNLTDHLPKPAYQLESRPKTKQEMRIKYKNQAKLKSVEKLAKTKYKNAFSKGIKSEKMLPIKLMKSSDKVKDVIKRKANYRKINISSKLARINQASSNIEISIPF